MYKKIISLLTLFSVICLTGCSSTGINPIDYVIPVPVPLGMEDVLDHNVPSIKGITLLGVLKGEQQELEFKMKLDIAKYNIAMEQLNLITAAGNNAATALLGLLATVGLGGAPLAFLAGAKKKRPNDLTSEDAQLKIVEAGLKDPEQFKSENNIS